MKNFNQKALCLRKRSAELVTSMIKSSELRLLQLKVLDTALIDCVILRKIFGMNLKHLS